MLFTLGWPTLLFWKHLFLFSLLPFLLSNIKSSTIQNPLIKICIHVWFLVNAPGFQTWGCIVVVLQPFLHIRIVGNGFEAFQSSVEWWFCHKTFDYLSICGLLNLPGDLWCSMYSSNNGFVLSIAHIEASVRTINKIRRDFKFGYEMSRISPFRISRRRAVNSGWCFRMWSNLRNWLRRIIGVIKRKLKRGNLWLVFIGTLKKKIAISIN